jgi:hypothetical protein
MLCPSDVDPADAHSYLLNKHLAKNLSEVLKAGSRVGQGRSTSDVVLMGEKITTVDDYYMETTAGTFDSSSIDPWDLPVAPQGSQ